MKKLKSILMVFCLLLCIYPMEVKAEETKSKFFTVDLEVTDYNCLNPGDTFSKEVEVKNTYNKPIRVRVCDVANIDNSVLYTALKADWDSKNSSTATGSFDDLTTDWFDIGVGQTVKLKLNMYFPGELGNKYQATKLNAKFTFECRVPEDAVSIPNTGDTSHTALWATLAGVSGGAFLILLFVQKRKKEDEQN